MRASALWTAPVNGVLDRFRLGNGPGLRSSGPLVGGIGAGAAMFPNTIRVGMGSRNSLSHCSCCRRLYPWRVSDYLTESLSRAAHTMGSRCRFRSSADLLKEGVPTSVPISTFHQCASDLLPSKPACALFPSALWSPSTLPVVGPTCASKSTTEALPPWVIPPEHQLAVLPHRSAPVSDLSSGSGGSTDPPAPIASSVHCGTLYLSPCGR